MEAAGADHFSYGIAFLILLSLAGLVVLVVLTTASEEPTPKASGKAIRIAGKAGPVPLGAFAQSAKRKRGFLSELLAAWFSRPPQQQTPSQAAQPTTTRDIPAKATPSGSRASATVAIPAAGARGLTDSGHVGSASASSSSQSTPNPRPAANGSSKSLNSDTANSRAALRPPAPALPPERLVAHPGSGRPPSPEAKVEQSSDDLEQQHGQTSVLVASGSGGSRDLTGSAWERAEGKKGRHRKTDSAASSSSSQPALAANGISSLSIVMGLSSSDAAIPAKAPSKTGPLNISLPLAASEAPAAPTSEQVVAKATGNAGVQTLPLSTENPPVLGAGTVAKAVSVPASAAAAGSVPTASVTRKGSRRSQAREAAQAESAAARPATANTTCGVILPTDKTDKQRPRSKSPGQLQTSNLPVTPNLANTKSGDASAGSEAGSPTSMITPPATPPSKPQETPTTSPTAKGKGSSGTSSIGDNETDKEKGKPSSGDTKLDTSAHVTTRPSGVVPVGGDMSPTRRTSTNPAYVRPPRFSPNSKTTAAAASASAAASEKPAVDVSASSPPVPKKTLRPPPGLNLKHELLIGSNQGLPTPSTPTSVNSIGVLQESSSVSSTPPPSPTVSSPSATSPLQSTRSGSSLSLTSPDGRFSPATSSKTMPLELLPSSDPLWTEMGRAAPVRSSSDEIDSGFSAGSSDHFGSTNSLDRFGPRVVRRSSMGSAGALPSQTDGARWYSPFDGGLSLTPPMGNVHPPTPADRHTLPRLQTDDLWSMQPLGLGSPGADYGSQQQADVWGSSFAMRNAGRPRNNNYDGRSSYPSASASSPWSPDALSPTLTTGHLLGHNFLAGLDRISGTIPPGTLLPDSGSSSRLGPSQGEDFRYQITSPPGLPSHMEMTSNIKMHPRAVDLTMGAGDLHYRAAAFNAAAQSATAPVVESDYGDSMSGWTEEQRRS